MSTICHLPKQRLSVNKAPRSILAHSIVSLLAPLLMAVGAVVLASPARGAVTAGKTGGVLADTLGATNDVSTLRATISGSTIEVTGTGFTTQSFGSVTQIDVDFTAASQTVTFDSTDFSFGPVVAITASTGASTDAVIVDGANTLMLTGSSTYGGGTTINGGVVSFNNANALGTGMVTLGAGTELRSTANLTLNNAVTFAGSGNSTVSAASGTTLVLGPLNLEPALPGSVPNAVFGSAGHAGVITVANAAGGTVESQATIEVADGTLRNGGGLGLITKTGSATTVDTGATLSVNDGSMEVANLLGTGAVTLGTSAATVLTLDAAHFGGVISGAGQINATTGTVVLSGANTYTGGTTVSSGTLQLGNGGTTGLIAGNVTDNGTLVFDRSNNLTFGGVISGSGSVTKAGSGVLTLTAANTYSGNTTITGGAISFKNANALGTGYVILDAGGELHSTANLTLANQVYFSVGGSSTVSAAAGTTLDLTDVNILGDLKNAVFGSAGNTGVVLLSGTGAINTGATIEVAAGTLRNGGNLNFFTSQAASTTVDAGATLDLNNLNNVEVTNLLGAGAVTLGSTYGLTVDAGNFAGVISGVGGLVKDTAGTLVLTGANTHTGPTSVDDGTLQIGNGGTTGSIVGDISVLATLVFDRSNAFTYAGTISGSNLVPGLGFVTQAGTGVLTLTGNNTYGGGTTINSGVLAINNPNALGTGNVTINAGGELRGTANVTLANTVNFTGTGNSTVSAAPGTTFVLDTAAIVGFVGTNPNAVFGSAGHTGVVVVNQLVSSGNSATDTIEVAFGTLRNGGGLGAFTDSVVSTKVDAGATLSVNDQSMSVNNLLGAGAVTLGTMEATTLTLQSGNFSGVISGAGTVIAHNGTVVLTGANTYTGGTVLGLAPSSLQIGNGGTTGSILGDVSSSGSLTFDRSNNVTFAGMISGTGSVTQAGSGVLALTGNSIYTGGTTINAGVLSVNNANALGGGDVTINPGGELRGTANLTLANTVNFTGGGNATASAAPGTTLVLSTVALLDTATNAVFGSPGNTGMVVVNQSAISGSSLTATIEVAYGTLRNGGGLGAITDSIASTKVDAGATLSINDHIMEVADLLGAGSVTLGINTATYIEVDAGNFSGVISGAGEVAVPSNDTLVLTGANIYTGGTTMSGGATLQVGNGGTTGSIVGKVSTNGNLVFDRSNSVTYGGIISAGGTVTQMGSGVLALTGNNTYTGGTVINAGVLSFNNPNALGTGNVSLGIGTELRGTANMSFGDGVYFAGTGSSTVSATPGATLKLTSVIMQDPAANAVFGSAGNTGVVEFDPVTGSYAVSSSASIEVAYGTLRNGEVLSFYTQGALSTTVNAGATLSVNDFNMEVTNLQGAGAVTLGTKAGTTLTLDAGSFSGVISGAGQVTKTTASTLMLTGVNTYTGGTTVTNGLFEVGNGGTTGSIAGNVTDNAKLAFYRSNSLSFGGIISGTGLVLQVGTGVTTLTGVNTYSGGTTIESGVLGINNANALGTGNVKLDVTGELRGTANVTLADEVDFAGNGTSTVSAASGTTLILETAAMSGSAVNAVFGSAGNAGVVVLSNGGLGIQVIQATTIEVADGTLRNGGSLDFYAANAISTTVKAGATLSINDQNVEVADLLGAGSVTLGSKAATVLQLDAGNFNGVISGAGQVTKATTGVLTLTGANSYTGGTAVSAGTLLVNNTAGSGTGSGAVAVNSGGTLGGSGKISGATTLNSGGTIAPGAGSPAVAGTILHASSLLWNGGGTITLQLGEAADELALGGTLTKGSAGSYILDLTEALPNFIPHTSYTLLTFASTTFHPGDFDLELPINYTGTLLETSNSLEIENLTDPPPLVGELPEGADLAVAGPMDSGPSTPDNLTVTPTPEPGSATLLAFGGGALLGWRQRRKT